MADILSLNLDLAVIVLIFIFGIGCLLATKNMIRMVIGIEIMARSSTFAFVYFGNLTGNNSLSQALVVTIIVVEVVVSAIALALIMNLYKFNKSLDVRHLNKLKG